MKILALDTTGIVATVAIVEKQKNISEISTNYIKNHSETILPMIDQCLKNINLNINEIDVFACSSGPGSFTGLRIGIATIKGLAKGRNKKIVSVPTLYGLAYNVYDTQKLIVPIMDARRNEVYAGFYKYEDETIIEIHPNICERLDVVFEIIEKYDKNVVFIGDGVNIFREEILLKGFNIAPYNMLFQRAGNIAIIAEKLAENNIFQDNNSFKPFYIRKSQAEREAKEF